MNITRFKIGPHTLKNKISKLGGKITDETTWSDDKGHHDIEIEVYFEEPCGLMTVQKVEELIHNTRWYVDWEWDMENNGILLEWSRYADLNT